MNKMFIPDKIYRNEAGRDLDIYVINVHNIDEKEINLRVHFIFRSNGNILQTDDITIQTKDVDNWKEVVHR